MPRTAIDAEAVRALIDAHGDMPGEIRFLIHDVEWAEYVRLVETLESGGIHITYLEGTIEVMVVHYRHERFKKLFGRTIEVMLMELGIRARSAGSTLFEKLGVERGIEPDECYYLNNIEALRGHEKAIDLEVLPPADLVIEVEITSPLLDKLGIYARLGFPEIWRFDGETLTVLLLQPDGTYRAGDRSQAFPSLPLAEFRAKLATFDSDDETGWFLGFRDWVREVVVPRHQG